MSIFLRNMHLVDQASMHKALSKKSILQFIVKELTIAFQNHLKELTPIWKFFVCYGLVFSLWLISSAFWTLYLSPKVDKLLDIFFCKSSINYLGKLYIQEKASSKVISNFSQKFETQQIFQLKKPLNLIILFSCLWISEQHLDMYSYI